MSINRISSLKEYGIFHDFSWPNDLHDFKRYNLIYGWNGSGKTMLSRLFRALELKTPPSKGNVKICIEGSNLNGDNFQECTLPIRVFNRDFINESVFPINGDNLPPIFVIGKENVEKQKKLNRLKSDLTIVRDKKHSVEADLQQVKKAFDKKCIDRASVIKETLRASGENPYNNYDKSSFKSSAQRMVDSGDSISHLVNEPERALLLDQYRASPKPKLESLSYQQLTLKQLANTVSQLISETVVSNAIQSLKNDLKLSEWTRKGLGLHQKLNSEQCLFCEQPLPRSRITKLESHFSAKYEEFMKRLDQYIEQLQTASKEIQDLKLPNKNELYNDLIKEYEVTVHELHQTLDKCHEFIEILINVLKEKKGRAFESLIKDITPPKMHIGVVSNVNEVIDRHNQACDDFQMRVKLAGNRLEGDLIASDIDEYVQLQTTKLNAEKSIKDVNSEFEQLESDIACLEQEILQHHKPAEELNNDLQMYLGHNELRLEAKDTGYAIMRNKERAEMLSEGEMTAIALLYFLKSLEDQHFDMNKGVVVLDDPVSSLDQNAIYYAFSYISERTENAHQLIVLTHNFTFFRLVRRWFRDMKKQRNSNINRRPSGFYMLDFSRKQNMRNARIQRLDPLLDRYESEYHYLFARIYRAATAPSEFLLEQYYSLPNIARRLLETFLAFKQPNALGSELKKQLKEVDFNAAKKARILRFVHTYSHSSAVGEPEHDPSILSEARPVLKDILSLIRKMDPAHSSAMIQLSCESANEEECVQPEIVINPSVDTSLGII